MNFSFVKCDSSGFKGFSNLIFTFNKIEDQDSALREGKEDWAVEDLRAS